MEPLRYPEPVWNKARAYHTLIRSGDCSDEQLATIKAWLGHNPNHQQCFRDIEVAHQQLRYSSLGEAAYITQRQQQTTGRSHHRTAYWLVAACFVALCSALLFFDMNTPGVIEYETALGEVADFELTDGSLVTLGAKSKILVDYSRNKRNIKQITGEALYKVTKDPARPFVVSVGQSQVKVLGTVFEVSKRGSAFQVNVEEGHVAVGNSHFQTELIANQSIRVAADGKASAITPIDTNQFAAWRQQRFVFTQTSMAEIVSVVNRYRQHPIKLSHPQIGAETVSASFRLDQLNQFLDALKVSHELDWYIDSNGVIWLKN